MMDDGAEGAQAMDDTVTPDAVAERLTPEQQEELLQKLRRAKLVGAAGSDPLQEEMPFGLVYGQAITKLPEDLYIPPEALEVFLEAFQGPLDLLLYLIKRQNLDILDIPVAQITTQYMQYVELMKSMNFELAAEYLVMAAMLGEIKSRMLLPRPKAEGDDDEDDPRAELIRRLQEYERFKKAAEDLDALPRLERDFWSVSARRPDYRSERPEPDVDLRELLLAFKEVLYRADLFESHTISREKLSTRERMARVLDHLRHREFVPFVSLFPFEEGRAGVVVTFLAVLELIKAGLVELVQQGPYSPIHVKARMVVSDEELPDVTADGEGDDADTGEPVYELPPASPEDEELIDEDLEQDDDPAPDLYGEPSEGRRDDTPDWQGDPRGRGSDQADR